MERGKPCAAKHVSREGMYVLSGCVGTIFDRLQGKGSKKIRKLNESLRRGPVSLEIAGLRASFQGDSGCPGAGKSHDLFVCDQRFG